VKVYSLRQTLNYCADRGIIVDDRKWLRFLHYRRGTAQEFSLLSAKEGSLAHLAAFEIPPHPFRGGLLAIGEWDVWNVDAVGQLLFESVLHRAGFKKALPDARFLRFSARDLELVRALLVPALLVPWDCYFIPEEGDHFVFVSHDSYGELHARNKRVFRKAKERFVGRGFSV